MFTGSMNQSTHDVYRNYEPETHSLLSGVTPDINYKCVYIRYMYHKPKREIGVTLW